MNVRHFTSGLLVVCTLVGCTSQTPSNSSSQAIAVPTPSAINANTPYPASAEIMEALELTANWQIPRLQKLDYLTFRRERSEEPKQWIQGAFYAGLTELAERSNNPLYEKWVGFIGSDWDWQLGPRPFHADDHLVGQTYLWYHLRNGGEETIAATQTGLDYILENRPTNSLEFFPSVNGKPPEKKCHKRWCWADALFMAPRTWFMMSAVTGDPKYAQFAHEEFKATADYLYDPELQLMYRDSRFKTMRGDFGEPIFWSRGLGWVFGGLARSMDYIPEEHPQRPFYEKLFREIAAKLLEIQKADGSWSMSLLAGEKQPEPETSGTGFFTYGFAWGIQNGLLDEAIYKPAALRGWRALRNAVHPNGKLGWVQGVSAEPGKVTADDSQIYGVGAYLLAGSQLYDLARKQELKTLRETFARFVPEREDDFAWENDKVAFRVYGPRSPAKGSASGVDAWFKSVPYPVVNKWYSEHLAGKSYHVDHGEGYDIYHTGTSRGVGGTAIWVEGKPYPAPQFHRYDLLRNTGEIVTFVLHYKWDTPIGEVKEAKMISLEVGDQLYTAESRFTLNGKPAVIPVAVGLTTHDEKAKVKSDKSAGWVSTWEIIDGKGVGSGALLQPDQVKSIVHQRKKAKDSSHIWIVSETAEDGVFEFRAGFAWEGAGEITTWDEWNQYLSR